MFPRGSLIDSSGICQLFSVTEEEVRPDPVSSHSPPSLLSPTSSCYLCYGRFCLYDHQNATQMLIHFNAEFAPLHKLRQLQEFQNISEIVDRIRYYLQWLVRSPDWIRMAAHKFGQHCAHLGRVVRIRTDLRNKCCGEVLEFWQAEEARLRKAIQARLTAEPWRQDEYVEMNKYSELHVSEEEKRMVVKELYFRDRGEFNKQEAVHKRRLIQLRRKYSNLLAFADAAAKICSESKMSQGDMLKKEEYDQTELLQVKTALRKLLSQSPHFEFSAKTVTFDKLVKLWKEMLPSLRFRYASTHPAPTTPRAVSPRASSIFAPKLFSEPPAPPISAPDNNTSSKTSGRLTPRSHPPALDVTPQMLEAPISVTPTPKISPRAGSSCSTSHNSVQHGSLPKSPRAGSRPPSPHVPRLEKLPMAPIPANALSPKHLSAHTTKSASANCVVLDSQRSRSISPSARGAHTLSPKAGGGSGGNSPKHGAYRPTLQPAITTSALQTGLLWGVQKPPNEDVFVCTSPSHATRPLSSLSPSNALKSPGRRNHSPAPLVVPTSTNNVNSGLTPREDFDGVPLDDIRKIITTPRGVSPRSPHRPPSVLSPTNAQQHQPPPKSPRSPDTMSLMPSLPHLDTLWSTNYNSASSSVFTRSSSSDFPPPAASIHPMPMPSDRSTTRDLAPIPNPPTVHSSNIANKPHLSRLKQALTDAEHELLREESRTTHLVPISSPAHGLHHSPVATAARPSSRSSAQLLQPM